MISFATPLTPITENQLGLIKFELLAEGLQISEAARQQLKQAKKPIRTRSGASGGLDIILPHNVYVNAPVMESFAKSSSMMLDYQRSEFVILKNETPQVTIQFQPTPSFYSKTTSYNTIDMVKIGQLCSGDRFCYGMTGPGCSFWSGTKRCKFCSIGNNYDNDASRKKERHLIEVLREAINDPVIPARHVLLGGGTPPGKDMGAIMAARLCSVIKKHFDVSVYVMIVAPLEDQYIDMLYDAGVDELGMNVEFWSNEAWAEYIPGKNTLVGKQRYLDALKYAVRKFGPINTRSLLIGGLEHKRFTIEGALQLAEMGIMPIISPFRPLDGTILENRRGFDGKTYFEMYQEIRSNIQKTGIPLGPTCIPCQNNVLALPFGEKFRFY